jgi:hypothetical protein
MPAIDTPPQTDMFRTSVLNSSPRVDRKAKVIFGANLMQLGDINDDRLWTVDEGTLANAKELMSRGNSGAKARFTHPNMSADGMGSFLGRWKDVRVEGEKLVGDLHLAEQAFKSPQGDLGTYVMDMAEEDPDMFGISLATKINDAEMEKLKLEKRSADPEWKGRTPLRFRAVHAADVVDEPAATRGGFFSSEVDNRNLPAQATMLLDAYFSDAEPEVVTARINGFLATYFKAKGHSMSGVSAPEKPVETTQIDLAAERKAAADLARQEERERVTRITALCKQAGKEDLAAGFCEKGLSVSEAQGELFNALCKSNTPVGDGGGSSADQTPDENAKYKAEFKAGKYSMTEEQYVSLRRAEDGLEEFVPAKK